MNDSLPQTGCQNSALGMGSVDENKKLRKPWIETPLIESRALSIAAGWYSFQSSSSAPLTLVLASKVFLKLENLQPSGSVSLPYDVSSEAFARLLFEIELHPNSFNKHSRQENSLRRIANCTVYVVQKPRGRQPCSPIRLKTRLLRLY